jgi:hypothetical protein
MKLSTLKNKKNLKIITLLASTLLIATASAQVYRYMFISGSVNITTGTGIVWVLGEEASAESSIAGSTATMSLDVANGTIANFTHVLYLQNQDDAAHSITIDITDAATTSLYDSFNVTVTVNGTGTLVDKLDATITDTYSGSIDASAIWQVSFEIQTDATTQTDAFAIQFRYE